MSLAFLAVWAIAGIAMLAAVVYAIGIYNSFVQVRNNVDKAWHNIEVLLMQRHDELPKLIDTCEAYVKHERGLLEDITKLRVGYDGSKQIDEKIRTENELNQKLARLRHVWEGYPDLKASPNFLDVQDRVSALESSIADRREFFNDSVNVYNIQIARIPEVLVARLLGYERHPFLEVPEEKTRDVEMSFQT